MDDQLAAVTAAITTQQGTIYALAAGDQPNHDQKLFLQKAWRQLDSALWWLRKITGEEPTPNEQRL